jgi:hypothetical protein
LRSDEKKLVVAGGESFNYHGSAHVFLTTIAVLSCHQYEHCHSHININTVMSNIIIITSIFIRRKVISLSINIQWVIPVGDTRLFHPNLYQP